MKVITKSSVETKTLGQKLSQILDRGDVVILEGPLGIGKTTFIKGVVTALGINEDEIRSPSFTIIKEYDTKKGKVYHIDLYRIDRKEELINLGYGDYFYEPTGIALIEWGERVENMLPKYIKIKMEFRGEYKRRIGFSIKGYRRERFKRIVSILNAER